MPGSKKNASGKELKKYVLSKAPHIIVLTNKPRERTCSLLCRDTGKILHQTSKNWDMLELVTSEGFNFDKPTYRRGGLKGLKVEYSSIRTQADNAAENIQRWVLTLMELSQTEELPKLKKTETGSIEVYMNGIKLPLTESNRKRDTL